MKPSLTMKRMIMMTMMVPKLGRLDGYFTLETS